MKGKNGQRDGSLFDPVLAIRTATATVLGLSASWGVRLREADREEIVAKAVAKAWMHRNAFDPGKASLQTWVGRIARNCLLDHLRAVRPLEARPLPEEELETAKAPDTLLVEDEQLDLFMRAMRSLPKSYRKVIALLSEGKRPREIALILHCTPNAANIRCSRARKALRDRLKRE